MRKSILLSVLLLLLMIYSFNSFAQDEEKDGLIEVYPGIDLMNRFIWRGMNLGGNSPSIQPYIALMIGNLEIGAWGAYSMGGINTNQEFDLYASFTFANDIFSVMLTDYYSASDVTDYNYFDYNKDLTGHIYEGALSFNGTENIPITFLAAVLFYGADAPKVIDDPSDPDFNMNDGIQYSNYFELGYSKLIKEVAFDAFLGFTLNNPKKADATTGYVGESGFYGSSPGVVNLGITASKEIPITEKFNLPVTASIITNPQTEKVFFLCGFSF